MIDGRAGYDQVSGYNIREIENSLSSTKTFENWEQNIFNNYDNGTKNNLDALFNFWN